MRSDFREEMAKAEVKLVLFVPPQKQELYQKFFGNDLVVVEPFEDLERNQSRARRLFRGFTYAAIPTETIWVRQIYRYREKRNPFAFAWKRGIWYLGHLRPFRALLRAVEFHLFRDDKRWEALFDKYKPDAVFGTNAIHDTSISMMKAARRRGIPDIGMMKSWDNLTSKGVLRYHPKMLLIQNELMRKEATDMNDMRSDGLRVIGTPQYDHYLDKENEWTREELCKALDLDPSLPIVSYFGGGLLTGVLQADDPTDHMTMLSQAVQRGDLPKVNLHLRTHPKDVFDEQRVANLPYVHPYRPGKKIEGLSNDWEFDESDIKILINIIRWSDVTINTGSTMTLECALFDKPVILTGFNGYKAVPFEKDIGVALNHTTHYLYVQRAGGVWRANNEKELIEATKTYLQNPSLHAEGRRKIVETLMTATNRAGKNAAEAVLSIIK